MDRNFSLKISSDTICSLAIMLVLIFNQFGNVIGGIFTAIIGHNSIDSAIQYGLLIVCVGYLFLHPVRYAIKYNAIFIAVVCILFVFTKYSYPQNYEYLSTDIPSILFTMLAFLVICQVTDINNILNALKMSAYVCLLYAIIIGFTLSGLISLPGFTTSYMVYGYSVLPAAVIFTYLYDQEREKKYLIYTIISLVFILMFGSRGALLYYCLFYIFYNIVINGVLSKRFLVSSLCAVIILLLLSNSSFVTWLSNFLTGVFGVSSRSISKLLEGSVTSDSGRSLLYIPAIEIIRENWLFGTGVYSDRALIYMASDDSASIGYGHYVHNLFLELFMDFGIPLSIILIVVYVYMFVKVMKYTTRDVKCVATLLTSLWFFESLTSGSFWSKSFLWASIAFLIVMCRKIKNGEFSCEDNDDSKVESNFEEVNIEG